MTACIVGHPYKQMWKFLIAGSMYCTVPYEIYHSNNCHDYLLYFHVSLCSVGSKRFSIFDVPPYQSVHFMAYLTALSLCLHLCLTSGRAAVDIPSVKKNSRSLYLC